MQPLSVQEKAAGDELRLLAKEGLHVLERAHLVIASGEHFEQGFRAGTAGLDARCEQPDDGLGQGDHRVDVLRPVLGVGMLVEVVQVLANIRVGLLTGLLDQRLLEQLEADASSQVTHDWVAQLGGADQSVDDLADLVARGPGHRLALAQPTLQ